MVLLPVVMVYIYIYFNINMPLIDITIDVIKDEMKVVWKVISMKVVRHLENFSNFLSFTIQEGVCAM